MNLNTFFLLFGITLAFASNSALTASHTISDENGISVADHHSVVASVLENDLQFIRELNTINENKDDSRLMAVLSHRFQGLSKTQVSATLKRLMATSLELGLEGTNALLKKLEKIADHVGQEMDKRFRRDWKELQQQHPWMWDFEKKEEAEADDA